MSELQKLNEPNVTGHFDIHNRIFYVTYRGTLNADTTNKAYMWLFIEGAKVNIANIHAFIFDFSQVTKFERENTFATKRQSQTARAAVDLSRIPAALVVKTVYQEQMVLLSTKVNEVEERTRIVKSQAEAMTFIDQFHAKLKKADAAAEKDAQLEKANEVSEKIDELADKKANAGS
jgi:hypothetical protein